MKEDIPEDKKKVQCWKRSQINKHKRKKEAKRPWTKDLETSFLICCHEIVCFINVFMFHYVLLKLPLLLFLLWSFMGRLPYSQFARQRACLWQTRLQGNSPEPSEKDAHVKLGVPRASPTQTGRAEHILPKLVLSPHLISVTSHTMSVPPALLQNLELLPHTPCVPDSSISCKSPHMDYLPGLLAFTHIQCSLCSSRQSLPASLTASTLNTPEPPMQTAPAFVKAHLWFRHNPALKSCFWVLQPMPCLLPWFCVYSSLWQHPPGPHSNTLLSCYLPYHVFWRTRTPARTYTHRFPGSYSLPFVRCPGVLPSVPVAHYFIAMRWCVCLTGQLTGKGQGRRISSGPRLPGFSFGFTKANYLFLGFTSSSAKWGY